MVIYFRRKWRVILLLDYLNATDVRKIGVSLTMMLFVKALNLLKGIEINGLLLAWIS